MTTTANYADLSVLKGITPKLLRFFSDLFSDTAAAGAAAADAGAAAAGAIASTGAIQNATVITLSANAAFNNERVLVLDPTYFQADDTGPNGQYRVTFIVPDSPQLPGPYASDAAAAAAGVDVGDAYRSSATATAGYVLWRQV